MNIIKTKIEGLLIIEPRIFEDSRGFNENSMRKLARSLSFKITKANHAMA